MNMIDCEERKQLSQDLRRLVTGRITNDEFDDVYSERFCHSKDQTVADIAEFGYGLYSNGTLVPYRLRGRYAVRKDVRRIVARCVLFLRAGREYKWPRWPYSTGMLRFAACFAGFGQSLGFAFTVVLFMLLTVICTIRESVAFVWPVIALWPIGVVGLASFVFSIWYTYWSGEERIRQRSAAWRTWLRAGDFDVWPFLRREDFYHARQTAFLLGAENAVSDIG